VRAVVADRNNWLAAVVWAFGERGDAHLGQELVANLWFVWAVLAPAAGLSWIAKAEEPIDSQTPRGIAAKLNYAKAITAGNLGQILVQLESSERALDLYRLIPDDRGVVRALSSAGRALAWVGRVDEAERMLFEAAGQARKLGMCKTLAQTLRGISFARNIAGDMAAAREYAKEAIAVYDGVASYRGAAMALADDLVEIELQAGNAELVLRHAHDAIPVLRAVGAFAAVAETLGKTAAALLSLQRIDEAESYARDSIALAREHNASGQLLRALQRLAAIALARHDATGAPLSLAERVARLLGFVDSQREALGSPRYLYDRDEHERLLVTLRAALGTGELQRLVHAGRALTSHDALAISSEL
jgi:tetratricopeptide (TPR) repeat protein